jgi:hypothetical protein
MRASMQTGDLRTRLAVILALLCWLASAGLARADNPSPFLDLDAGACARLDDKNLQVGPPDADIVAACAAYGRRAVFGQRFDGGLPSLALLLAGAALVYVVLGVPIRPLAGLLGRGRSHSRAVLSLETVVIVLLRVGVAFAALAILSLPFAIAGGSLVTLAAAVLSLRPWGVAPPDGAAEPRPSEVGLLLADAINDVYASAAGILALATLTRRDPWWLSIGLALAFIASAPALIAARRRIRRQPVARLATTAVFAAIFGAAALSDPDLSPYAGDALTPALASAAVFALIVLGAGLRARATMRFPAAAG